MSGLHTPGPWAVDDDFSGIYITSLPDQSALPIARIVHGRGESVSVANARLIAAAPELLAHLEFAVKLLSGLFGGTAQVERMRATIAKAKGGAA